MHLAFKPQSVKAIRSKVCFKQMERETQRDPLIPFPNSFIHPAVGVV